MTQEEKQLLLKVLCEGLPYGVIVKECDGVKENNNKLLDIDMFDRCINYDYTIEDIKPYLRPMDSMTEEEAAEFEILSDKLLMEADNTKIWNSVVDWLNERAFDHRGLIPMGLALVAPEDMYK